MLVEKLPDSVRTGCPTVSDGPVIVTASLTRIGLPNTIVCGSEKSTSPTGGVGFVLNVMVSAPGKAALLAWVSASRSESAPESLVFLTMKVLV